MLKKLGSNPELLLLDPELLKFELKYPGESISPGYDTPVSQFPRGMRPREVTQDPGESTAIS